MGKVGRKLIRALREMRDVYDIKKKEPWYTRVYYAIYLSDLLDPIYNLHTKLWVVPKERVKRIYAYAKAVWEIGEWDWSWHMRLMSFSLKRLHKCMKNGSSVFSKTKERKMLTAIALLDRMVDPWESYHEPASKAFEKRWSMEQVGFELLDHPEDIANPRPHLKRWYTSRDRFRDNLPPDKRKQYDKEYKELLNIEDKMFKKDMELFCKIFSRHVQSWWD